MKRPNKGGARPGAGRPPNPNRKRTIAYRLAPDVLAYLDTQPNKAKAIEDAVRGTDGYRKWKPTPSISTGLGI